MEHKKKLIHVTKMPIRWGDMDAYGHVNNTVYFRYMEQARVEWLEDMKIEVRPGGLGPVIISASCTFSVSYTHLDVYKRQSSLWGSDKWIVASGRRSPSQSVTKSD